MKVSPRSLAAVVLELPELANCNVIELYRRLSIALEHTTDPQARLALHNKLVVLENLKPHVELIDVCELTDDQLNLTWVS